MKYLFQLTVVFLLLFLSSGAQNSNTHTSPTMKDRYAKRIGNLRLSATTVQLGHIKNNEIRIDTIYLMNSGKRVLTLAMDSRIPDYLQVKAGQAGLEPGAQGWLAIHYDAAKRKEYGFVLERIFLNTNDSVMPMKTIHITTTIDEYFPPLSGPDSLNLPKSRIEIVSFNYGRIKQGEKASHDFVIHNDGNRELIVHKARSSCDCMKTDFSKYVIPPLDSTIVHVVYDSAGKDGTESRKVSIFVNDREMPEIRLEMRGDVVK